MVNLIHRLLCLFFICILITGCKRDTSPENEDEAGNVITLIFDKSDPPSSEIIFEGGRRLNVNRTQLLIHDNQTVSPIDRDFGKVDTVSIETKSDFILLQHTHHVIETYSYLIKNGDSIFFEYENETPIASVLNRRKNQTYYNVEFEFGKKHPSKHRFLPINTYYNPYLLVDFSKGDYNGQVSKIQRESYLESKDQFKRQISFIDSLYNQKAITSEVFSFYKDKFIYNELMLDLYDGRIELNQAKKILKDNYSLAKTLSFSEYKGFAKSVAHVFYIDKAHPVDLGYTTIVDYREAYDTIKTTTLFDQELKDELLGEQLEKIAEYFSLEDFQKYFRKFEVDVSDSSRWIEMKSKYFLEFNSTRLKADSLYLMTSGKRKTTFNEIVELNKGKLIYVDFWASWCAPCRAAMPDSKKLRARYHRDVVFVYLSIDKDFGRWMGASKDEGLQDFDNNYLIVNTKTSDYLKKLNLNEIPRYILIGKNGELIQSKAPAPNSKEILRIFEEAF